MRQATDKAKAANAKRPTKTPAKTASTSRKIEPAPIGEPLLYDIRQTAAKLSLSYPTIERLIARGELFSVKAEGKRLIPAWATIAYTRALCEQADPHGRYAHEYGLMAG